MLWIFPVANMVRLHDQFRCVAFLNRAASFSCCFTVAELCGILWPRTLYPAVILIGRMSYDRPCLDLTIFHQAHSHESGPRFSPSSPRPPPCSCFCFSFIISVNLAHCFVRRFSSCHAFNFYQSRVD